MHLAFNEDEAKRWQALSEDGRKLVNTSYVANGGSFTAILTELGYQP